MATPVEVSLWVSAYASAPGSGHGTGCVPAADSTTVGADSHGARPATAANLAENSPKLRCCECHRIRPNAAASQNAVVPPLPSATV